MLDPLSSFYLLNEETKEKLKAIDRVDIVVGIPSYNNAGTIGKVVSEVGRGLRAHFPRLKSLILNSDGGSTDGTRDVVRRTPVPEGIQVFSVVYEGIPGKGSALRTVFEAADLLQARFCIVTDADSQSITPEWVKSLGDPIYLRNYGYTTPYYLRDKYDGTITNALVYPLTSALYGQRIRQPIGGDFGMSKGLLKNFIYTRDWDWYPDVCKFGVDIWMTTTAICEGFRICQSSLGTKVHDIKDPSMDLGPMFRQVVGTMFGLMRKYEVKWQAVKKSQPVYVAEESHIEEIRDLKIGIREMIDQFHAGFQQYSELWREILEEDNFQALSRLSHRHRNFSIPVDLWARIVYDYAVYYNFVEKTKKREILDSLAPLYYGRTASFALESRTISDEMSDAFVEGCANVFERLKPYLIKRWNEHQALGLSGRGSTAKPACGTS